MKEQGTNLMFTAKGTKRFEIIKVIQSSLPSMPFGDIYPSVDDLVEQYIEDDPDGVVLARNHPDVGRFEGELVADEWAEFLHDWAQHIVDVNAMLRNEEVDMEQMLLILEEEFLPYEASLWQVANAVLDREQDRQQALSSITAADLFVVIQQALRENNAQLNFIRALNDVDDNS